MMLATVTTVRMNIGRVREDIIIPTPSKMSAENIMTSSLQAKRHHGSHKREPMQLHPSTL
jgi:hypothetical protein